MEDCKFAQACDTYREIIRRTEDNPEERKRLINLFRCGLL